MGNRQSSGIGSYIMKSILIAVFIALGIAACYEDSCGCSIVPPTGIVVVQLRDAAGAPVVGTTVTLTHSITNLIQSAQTNVAGSVIFDDLAPGQYSVAANIDASKYRFAPNVTHPRVITVGAGQTIGIEFNLAAVTAGQ